MTRKIIICFVAFALTGLIVVFIAPIWETLLFLHAALASSTFLMILTSPRTKSRDLFTLGMMVLDAGRRGLTLFAIALTWMTTALFTIPLREFNQLENTYGANAPMFGLISLLIYPFIPILLSPRKEYHDLLFIKFRKMILEPSTLEEFLVARTNEKRMEEFTFTHFPEINSLYKANEDSRVILEVLNLFHILETKLKNDPGFAPVLKSYNSS